VSILAAPLLSLLAVGVHYEALVLGSAFVNRVAGPARVGVALGVVIALAAHMVEVLLYAVAWMALINAGAVELNLPAPTPLDAVYFSGAVYTSLGFGDIVPVRGGHILAVSESVTGLVLIAWTASFTFYEMRAHWETHRRA
jgi:hypothetical protein